MFRTDPENSFFTGYESFFRHIHGNADSSLRSSLPIAGLQHPQFAFFNGKLHILHFAVMVFKASGNGFKFHVRSGHFRFQLENVFGQSNSRHNIFALRVGEVISFNFILTCASVAGHGDTGGAVVAHVAENHRYNADSSTQVMRNSGGVAVVNSPFAIPAFKNRLGCQTELFVRVCRKFMFGMASENFLEFFGNGSPVFAGNLCIAINSCTLSGCSDHFFKVRIRNVHDHASKHLNQSAIGIVNKSFIFGKPYHAFCGFIVQTNVQNRIHHARHGKLGARPAGDQKRVFRIAEYFSCSGFNLMKGLNLLVPHAFGKNTACGQVCIAGFCGYGKSRGYGDINSGHFRKVCTLAAQKSANRIPASANIRFNLLNFIKEIYPFFCHLCLPLFW